MNHQTKPPEREIRILRNLHLTGTMGKCGSLSKKDRLTLLMKLIADGYLTEDCTLTPAGVEVSRPFKYE